MAVQVSFMTVAYSYIKPLIPVSTNWLKGASFGAAFMLCIQAPATLGLIGFEEPAWNILTQTCVESYVTVFDDILVFLIVGALLGVAFPTTATQLLVKPRRLGLAMLLSGIVFPVVLWAVENGAFWLFAVNDSHAPTRTTWWFNLVFYGVFTVSGASLAVVRSLTRQLQQPGWQRHWLGTTGWYCLVWLPVQNFMVAFGWPFWGGLCFSLVSIIPVALTVWLADTTIKAEATEAK
jgi:hypothetical protein